MTATDTEKPDTLLTKISLEQSLAPPRSPPHFTSHRLRLLGKDPSHASYALLHGSNSDNKDNDGTAHSEYNYHTGIRDRIEHLLQNQHILSMRNLRHPHLSLGPGPSDRLTRYLGATLPLTWQNKGRDSGTFGTIADALVTCSIPMAAIANPQAAIQFLKLTKNLKRIYYGNHPSNYIDLFFPENCTEEQCDGLLFFVHGGAWGSGKPWFYRLVATPFLEQQMSMVVAIVGYRVYPYSQTVDEQVYDLECASKKLAELYPNLCGMNRTKRSIGTCVMGHSSGAHIALLMIVERLKRQVQRQQQEPSSTVTGISTSSSLSKNGNDIIATMPIDAFVGLSGPYDINHHFCYEASRGVEEISPMKAANGYSRSMFQYNSPCQRLKDFLATIDESNPELSVDKFLPPMALICGVEDVTVPFTATSEAANVLRSCGLSRSRVEEIYVPQVGHQEDIVQVMLGGKVRNVTVDWLSKYNNKNNNDTPQRREESSPILQSKL